MSGFSRTRKVRLKADTTYARIAALALAIIGTVTVACSVPPEQSILDRFFAAARLRDRTVLSHLATVAFEPLKDGIITDYTITRVTRSVDNRRDVTITAPVRLPDGRTVNERLVVTLERGVLQDDPESARRWIVTGWVLSGIDGTGR